MSPGGTVPMSPSITLERTIRFESTGSTEVSNSPGTPEPSSREARPTAAGIEETARKQRVKAGKGGWSWRSFGWKSKSDAEGERDYA